MSDVKGKAFRSHLVKKRIVFKNIINLELHIK